MADVRAVFKTDLLGERLETVYARCVAHGLQEVRLGHCAWCAVFLAADNWEASYEAIKVRSAGGVRQR